jgi:hypothetical protein
VPRAQHGSTDVLEHILSHDECDVDPINKIEKATPLHLAMRIEDPEMRLYMAESLIDAGADLSYVLSFASLGFPDWCPG